MWLWFTFFTQDPKNKSWRTRTTKPEIFPLSRAKANHSACEHRGSTLPGRRRFVTLGLGWICQMQKTDGWLQRKTEEWTDQDECNEREAELHDRPLDCFCLFFLLVGRVMWQSDIDISASIKEEGRKWKVFREAGEFFFECSHLRWVNLRIPLIPKKKVKQFSNDILFNICFLK